MVAFRITAIRVFFPFAITAFALLFFAPPDAKAIGGRKTISVRIFIDEEEPRIERLWQETLARRLDAASTILSQYSNIRFSCTKFSQWDSDDMTTDFDESLKEFEREAKPEPAELSIGFTSQYRLQRGRSNLGGTRGPMRKHILIREGAPNIQEVERLEVLVHELAHYLGAAHSGDLNSVMRPVLGDGKSRARAFQIRLDQSNAKIVQLISTEMATRHINNMHALTLPTRTAIREQYLLLAKENPEDPVAKMYASLMDRSIKSTVAQRQKLLQLRKRKLEQQKKPPPTESAPLKTETPIGSSG